MEIKRHGVQLQEAPELELQEKEVSCLRSMGVHLAGNGDFYENPKFAFI